MERKASGRLPHQICPWGGLRAAASQSLLDRPGEEEQCYQPNYARPLEPGEMDDACKPWTGGSGVPFDRDDL
jgi:hypothetical protein